MPPRRSRRSRSPRADAQEPCHFRGRIDGYEDLSITEDETRHAGGNSNYQTSGWHSPHPVGNHTVARHPDGSVSGNGAYHDLMSDPGWPTLSTGNQGETLSSNNYSSVNFNDPWNDPTVARQDNPDDGDRYSVPSFLASATDGASMSFPSLAHGQAPSFPSSVFQPAQVQTAPSYPDWTSEDDAGLTQTYRRFSTRARQGSSVQTSDSGPYRNNSMDQNGGMEENDSNESSAETSPVDQSQYFRSYGGDDPWSSECLRSAAGHRR